MQTIECTVSKPDGKNKPYTIHISTQDVEEDSFIGHFLSLDAVKEMSFTTEGGWRFEYRKVDA